MTTRRKFIKTLAGAAAGLTAIEAAAEDTGQWHNVSMYIGNGRCEWYVDGVMTGESPLIETPRYSVRSWDVNSGVKV